MSDFIKFVDGSGNQNYYRTDKVREIHKTADSPPRVYVDVGTGGKIEIIGTPEIQTAAQMFSDVFGV